MAQAPKRPPTLTDVTKSAVTIRGVRVSVSPPRGPAREATLGIAPLTIGTSPDCDIVVDDPRVSRRHVELSLTDDDILLRDLGSKNGTLIGGVRVREAFLPPDGAASFGGSKLRLKPTGEDAVVPLSPSAKFGEAIGGSLRMRALFADLEKVSPTDATVLLLGESGTGKELLARGIHDASPRRGGPFVVFDCSAVPANLVENELFGHRRGAFTGAADARAGLLEAANNGTLFIDEIGELPLDAQRSLLRALEDRKVKRLGDAEWRSFDARIIAATHRDLRTRMASGEFREDLFYRLAVAILHVPPLRDRKDDIPLLIDRFFSAFVPPRSLRDLPPNAMDLLQAHRWPGNVRELRNTAARLVIFGEDALAQLISDGAEARPGASGTDIAASWLALPWAEASSQAFERFARSYIRLALKKHGGNKMQTAKAIGVSRPYLYRLIEEHGIDDDEP